MSGEKAHRARVVSPEELQRRAVASARARCAALQVRLAKLADAVEGTVNSHADFSMQGLDSLRNVEAQLQGAIRDATAALELQRARAQLTVIVEQVDSVELGPVSLGIITKAEAGEVAKSTGTVLERLSEIEDSSFVDATLKEVHGVGSLPEPQQKLAMLSLQHAVAQAVKAQRITKRCQADAYSEAIRVAHLDGEVASAILDRAAEVKDQAALVRFRAEVEDVLEAAEREANTAFITQQAMVVMAELGYVVDEPFESIDHHGDGFLARRADLPKHALQVSVDAMAEVLQTRVVAVGTTTSEEDVRAEEGTCDDALLLVRRLSGHGVESETLFHRPSGDLPVAKAQTTAPPKKKRAQLKEMGLNG